MNYYERHLGDYARDTAHLSILEHGVYTLLLDRYYATEQPIPADQAHRVARARSREEKAAVDAVLSEFFVLEDGAYRNHRGDEEIEKARARITAAQENGRRGGRPKKNPVGSEEKPGGFSLGSKNKTQQKAHQTPDTIQEQDHSLPQLEELHPAQPESGGGCTAAEACAAMIRGGASPARLNHADPRLLAACAAGATAAMFEATASEANGHDPRKSPGWILQAVLGRLSDAKNATTGTRPHAAHRPSLAERAAAAHRSADERDRLAGNG